MTTTRQSTLSVVPATDFTEGQGLKSSAAERLYSFLIVASRLCTHRFASTAALFGGEDHSACISVAEARQHPSRPVADNVTYIPASLNSDEVEEYESFGNTNLWPVYHGLDGPARFDRSGWEAYRAANARFAQQAVEIAAPGATIVVDDFKLQLVPQMIRVQRPDVRLGFFTRAPFPSKDVFAHLPWREELVKGMLAADVIGFQRDSDVKHFHETIRSVTETGLASTVTVGTYPESIDAPAVTTAATNPGLWREARQLRHSIGEPRTLIGSVDQLDCTTGVLHQLHAYEELLDEGRIDAKDTTFVQFAIPSRFGSDRQLRDEVEHLIGRINGRFGTLSSPAVYYHHRPCSLRTRLILYMATDVFLVTSLREGTLFAEEYVATRHGRGGVLVLSEFARSAALAHAAHVNPHDSDAFKHTILHSLNMSDLEARARLDAMAEALQIRDDRCWARRFLTDLGLWG